MSKPGPSVSTATQPTSWLWQLTLAGVSAVVVWAGVQGWRSLWVSEPAPTLTIVKAEESPAQHPPKTKPTGPAPEGMVWIPIGEFSMGASDPRSLPHGGPDSMADARPVHRVALNGYWIDKTEVTNDQYEAFVKATGYVTVAERTPTLAEFPGAPPENLVAGSVVFTPPKAKVPLDDHYRWWSYVKGANWRHPTGPTSQIEGRGNEPVVQVAYEDAEAYAKWAGKRIPTEAEWEYAARGGLESQPYAWGDELKPGGQWMANVWQGNFPTDNSAEDAYPGIAPVAKFPPNGFGLFDMSGNVWEWCADWYRPDTYAQTLKAGKVAFNPKGPPSGYDPSEPNQSRKRVHRGGSFLCTDLYCTRYMVGTRGKGEVSSAANHLGFRCVKDSR